MTTEEELVDVASVIIIHDVRHQRATLIGGSAESRREFARQFCESYGLPLPCEWNG